MTGFEHKVTCILYQCRSPKCGFYFIQLNHNLWYGPIWEIATAHLMTTDQRRKEYGHCKLRWFASPISTRLKHGI